MSNIPSPCVSMCALNAGDFCLGCGRSVVEITRWSQMMDDARMLTLAKSNARMDWMAVDGRLRAIMALGQDGQAGKAGGLPWRMPSELAWFKQASARSVMIMGRSTWESLPSALPGREIAVIGSSEPKGLAGLGARGRWVQHLDQARDWAFDLGKNACVVGGAKLWLSAWSDIECAWITRVEGAELSDATFNPDLTHWKMVADGPAGADGPWTWRAGLWERAS